MPEQPAYPAAWTTARLMDPPASGFAHLALSSGTWNLPPALPSARRRKLRDLALDLARSLTTRNDVLEASVFTALVRPPGGEQAGGEIAFDVVLLVETTDVSAARSLVE